MKSLQMVMFVHLMVFVCKVSIVHFLKETIHLALVTSIFEGNDKLRPVTYYTYKHFAQNFYYFAKDSMPRSCKTYNQCLY